jgi:hypothetical protein
MLKRGQSCSDKKWKLVSGGHLTTTPFSCLKMGVKALKHETVIDTNERLLKNNAFQVHVS